MPRHSPAYLDTKPTALQTVGALLHCIQDAGLTPVLTGDLPLALLYYPDQGVRAINQLQLWTPAAQMDATQTQLAQAGWQPYRTKADWLARPLLNSRPQRFRRSGDELTLNWRSLSPAHVCGQNTAPLSISGLTAESADATALLIAVCVQGIVDFWRYGAIQWLADATMLLRSATVSIDWPWLVAQVAQGAMTVRMNAALAALQASLDAPIPPTIRQTVVTLPVQPFAVTSAYLSLGYWNDHTQTQQRYRAVADDDQQRTFFTEDRGRFDANGALLFYGRADFIVKVRGYRVDLSAIEALLNSHPDVQSAFMVAQPRAHNEPLLVAYLTLNNRQSTQTSVLHAFLAQHLPPYMLPDRFVVLDKMPLTASGKVDRQALPPIGYARPALEMSFVVPRTVTEMQLATRGKNF